MLALHDATAEKRRTSFLFAALAPGDVMGVVPLTPCPLPLFFFVGEEKKDPFSREKTRERKEMGFFAPERRTKALGGMRESAKRKERDKVYFKSALSHSKGRWGNIDQYGKLCMEGRAWERIPL